MANRMISYGYGIRDGKLSVIEAEEEIVRRIFFEYIDGKRLDKIAEELTRENVEFFMGNCEWNKSRIKRILDNDKYIGADGYPQIVDDDDFIYAGQLKDSKGAKKIHFEEHIEYLRNNKVICSQCGGNFRRVSTWRSREKWMCRQGCKNDIYVDDNVLFSAIFEIAKMVAEKPEIIMPIEKDNANSLEVRRCTSEVNRIFNEKPPTFSAGKKLIFHLAEVKFEMYDEKAPDIYTDMIVADCERVVAQEKVDRAFMEKYCETISVDQVGFVTVRFINGVEVSNRKEV